MGRPDRGIYLNSNRETQPTAVSDVTGRYIVNNVFPIVNPVFSAGLRLLCPSLGLDFASTNLPLNFLRAPSRSKYYSTPQPVFESFSQSTLPANFHSLISRALFL